MKVEDVKLWLDSSVTKEFFEYIEIMKKDYNIIIHQCLQKSEAQQAIYYNAGLDQLEEVLEIPDRIITYIKDTEENDET